MRHINQLILLGIIFTAGASLPGWAQQRLSLSAPEPRGGGQVVLSAAAKTSRAINRTKVNRPATAKGSTSLVTQLKTMTPAQRSEVQAGGGGCSLLPR